MREKREGIKQRGGLGGEQNWEQKFKNLGRSKYKIKKYWEEIKAGGDHALCAS